MDIETEKLIFKGVRSQKQQLFIQNIVCTKCLESLPATREYFYLDRQKKNTLSSWCKKCRHTASRNAQYKCRYGITIDEYNKMLQVQNGRCAICGELPSNKRLCIDHDHNTGAVRGLLCIGCNVAIGWFERLEEHKVLYSTYLEDSR